MDNKSTFQELFNKDYKNGKSNEERVVKFLNDNTYYQYYLEKKKFSLYDFKIFNEPNRLEELKSRDFFHDDFETAMIGKEKIEKAIKYHKKMKFQFWYLYKDGLFYYDFNIEDIKNANIFLDFWCRTSRGREEKKLVYYIPKELLTFFSDEITF
tara:strand:+ start:766 stop:1227 length:462 start_codon:yes stop_codon:yes gene_type:complete